VAVKGG